MVGGDQAWSKKRTFERETVNAGGTALGTFHKLEQGGFLESGQNSTAPVEVKEIPTNKVKEKIGGAAIFGSPKKKE